MRKPKANVPTVQSDEVIENETKPIPMYSTEYATTNHINMVNELAKEGWRVLKLTILKDEPFYLLQRDLFYGVPNDY